MIKHLELNPTPQDIAKLKEKIAMRHLSSKYKLNEQKQRLVQIYEKINTVNEFDPFFSKNIGDSQTTRKISQTKKKMRATVAQNSMFDKYSFMVNSYIEQLDNPIKKQNSCDQIRLSNQKMTILKNLLSKYNSKFLQKNNYNKLINSFGLQIQPIKKLKRFQNSDGKSKLRNKLQKLIEQQIKNQMLSQQMANKNNQIQLQEDSFQPVVHQFLQDQSKQLSKTFVLPQKDTRSRKIKTQRRGVSQIANKRNSCPDEIRLGLLKLDNEQHNFENRLNKYRQFLFIINFSNGIYRNLEIQCYKKTVKYYIGKGNNSNLIRSILKNRFWWEQSSLSESNFVWTQIKVDDVFESQDFYPDDLEYFEQQIPNEAQQELKSPKKQIKSLSMTIKKGTKLLEPQLPQLKLLSTIDYKSYLNLWKHQNSKSIFQSRSKGLTVSNKSQSDNKIHNHLPKNQLLGNKKAMFYSLKQYYSLTNKDIFSIVPLTYHIQNGTKDPQFKLFIEQFNRRKIGGKANNWIIKPGEHTNRGNGISCSKKLDQIKQLVSRKISKNNQKRTFILQSYISRPLLYHRRKFDIRAYMLLTGTNGRLKGYWYQEGYVRTSSSFFDLNELDDPMIHLTNDAVQKNGDTYGRFEAGNKITYTQLQRYIDTLTNKVDFFTMIYPQMRRIATDSIKSTAVYLDRCKHQSNFELFGLDFMIDEDYKVWLIEINTNPCLQLSCGILQRLIPHLIQNVFRIAVDPIFPPPSKYPFTKRYNVLQNALHYNKFQLVFDEIKEGKFLHKIFANSNLLQTIGQVKQDQEMYQDQGEIINIQNE